MKEVRKITWLWLAMLMLTVGMTACADNEKVIEFNQLPKAAQNLVNKHFRGKKVALVRVDYDGMRREYDVTFNDGSKIEFNSKGQWTDIECRTSKVPSALIPMQISRYVNKNYPATAIKKIEHDRYGYEIELSNGLEIKFNKKMKVTEIDH
ncbi:MAG: PepSY-like domain-containing protein [Prevotella sp.]|nr:PepSY-like domain-containing protein [Prevotella sp.]